MEVKWAACCGFALFLALGGCAAHESSPGDTGPPTREKETCVDVDFDCAEGSCSHLVAMTRTRFQGQLVKGEQWGHEQCEAELGEGWRWYEWHDLAHASWADLARACWQDGCIPIDTRGWAWIDDQNAECFSSPTDDDGINYGLTLGGFHLRDRQKHDSDQGCPTGVSCTDHYDFYQGPAYRPRGENGCCCDPYIGDTRCDQYLPLLCIKEN
jgi:hypothetical protein